MKKTDTLKEYQIIANLHVQRLLAAIEKTHYFFPMKEELLNDLKDEEVAFLDMLTTRFGRLQDIIGAKIFPLILDLLGENDISFLDRLNKLEKLKIIQDSRWWMQLREIRNQITHDYPNNYAIISAHFNQLLPAAKRLLLEWESIQKETLPRLY